MLRLCQYYGPEKSDKLGLFCDCNRYTVCVTFTLHLLFEILDDLMFTFQNNGKGVGPWCSCSNISVQ